MKNKVSSKDYQPIKFHRGRPHLIPPGKTGEESDLNEGDSTPEKDNDSSEDTIDRDEAPKEEKEKERDNSYEEEDENEKKERTRF